MEKAGEIAYVRGILNPYTDWRELVRLHDEEGWGWKRLALKFGVSKSCVIGTYRRAKERGYPEDKGIKLTEEEKLRRKPRNVKAPRNISVGQVATNVVPCSQLPRPIGTVSTRETQLGELNANLLVLAEKLVKRLEKAVENEEEKVGIKELTLLLATVFDKIKSLNPEILPKGESLRDLPMRSLIIKAKEYGVYTPEMCRNISDLDFQDKITKKVAERWEKKAKAEASNGEREGEQEAKDTLGAV